MRTRVWVIFWTIFGVSNLAASKWQNSLCETVRDDFRMETRRGRILFDVAFVGGMALLRVHVRKPYRPARLAETARRLAQGS